MPKTTTQRQQECRARKAAKRAPAKAASKRLYRLLVDHPAKLAKFEMFMVLMNREIRVASGATLRDAQRSTSSSEKTHEEKEK